MISGFILLLGFSQIYAYPKDAHSNKTKIEGRFRSFGDMDNLLPGSQYEGQQYGNNFNQQPNNLNNVPSQQQFGFNNQPGYPEYRPAPSQGQYPNQFYPNRNYFQQYPNQPGPYQSQFPQQYPNQNYQEAQNLQGAQNLQVPQNSYPQQYPNQVNNFYPNQYPQSQNQYAGCRQNCGQYPNQDGQYQPGNTNGMRPDSNMMYPTQFQDADNSTKTENKINVPDKKEDVIAFPDD